MSEQCGHRAIAAQSGAVHIHEVSLHGMPNFLELVNAPRQTRLAGSGWPHQQQRIACRNGYLLNPVNQTVKCRIASFNAAFEKRRAFPLLLLEAGSDAVVTREIEIDDFESP